MIDPRTWHAVVRLGADEVAVPLDAVREIAQLPAITRVPDMPAFVLGVADCDGALATVIDPQLLLGGAPWRRTREARALVFGSDAGFDVDGAEPLCVVVDALRGVGATSVTSPVDGAPRHGLAELARGWTRLAGGSTPLPVLDVARLRRRLARELAARADLDAGRSS